MFRIAARRWLRLALPSLLGLVLTAAICTAAEEPVEGSQATLQASAHWQPGFQMPGVVNSILAGVLSMVEYQGQLVLGGFFISAGSSAQWYLASWDGSTAKGLGSGVDSPVELLGVCGNDLFAALQDNRIMRWDGSRWTTIGSAHVNAMIEFRGQLVVLGGFSTIGGVPANRIASWDGSAWHALGSGLSTTGSRFSLTSLAVWRDALFVGGEFDRAGDADVFNLARWDGVRWRAVHPSPGRGIKSLAVHEGRLVAAGTFTEIGDVVTGGVAAWDGTQWEALGVSVPALGDWNLPWILHSGSHGLDLMAQFCDPYIAGAGVIRWDGHKWRFVLEAGTILDVGRTSMAEYRGDLVVGGSFEVVEDRPVGGLLVRRGAMWQPLIPGQGLVQTSAGFGSGEADAMLERGDGLVVGGDFDFAGTLRTRSVALWDGANWHAFGDGIDGKVHALADFQGDLVVAGEFSAAGGSPAANIARWDGSHWQPIGEGFGPYTDVRALVQFGDDLIAAGVFNYSGTRLVHNVARWDGTQWQRMNPGYYGGVQCLAVFRGELIAGGWRLDRWTGNDWVTLGGDTNGSVYDLVVEGDKLYAFGTFTEVGGVTAPGVAVWDGASWSSVGAAPRGRIQAGTIRAGRIVVGTSYEDGWIRGTVQAWNGRGWELLGSSMNGYTTLLYSADSGLYVGGDIYNFGGVPASGIACYQDGLTPIDTRSLAVSSTQPWAIRPTRLDPAFARLPDGGVRISFTVASPATTAALAVYDVRGRVVRMLEKGRVEPGSHVATWDGRDATGQRVARGVYFVDLSTGNARQTRKLVLMHD
jgi:trimeric autotransporter adhesin